MVGRGSPRLNLLMSKAWQKKNSPKGCAPKKSGGMQIPNPNYFVGPHFMIASSLILFIFCVEKTRASWNPSLEKTLVELLHEHNTPHYRGQNGWSSEAWNKMVKEFHEKNTYVTFTKGQIQEKEKELKREYRMLKEARKQSGAGWNEQRSMIEAEEDLWNNLITSNQKLRKFKNKSFPLFEELGQLYDGHIAEGTYNFNSTQPPQHVVLTQVENVEELSRTEVSFANLEETIAYTLQEDEDISVHISENEDESVARNEHMMNKRTGTTTISREQKETKRPKKQNGNIIAGYMERYIDMKEKQFETESARLACEKEAAKVEDYSIKRCISVLNTMKVTINEKATAFDLFKDPDNREIFLSSSEDDSETALVWLRNHV